jgi:hypothetical protein
MCQRGGRRKKSAFAGEEGDGKKMDPNFFVKGKHWENHFAQGLILTQMFCAGSVAIFVGHLM